ncbi:vitamin B12 transporter BtuB [Microbulbifer aestuariivivens]|uniref:Vitamin B12 transporter BtuB n=1 Tax=Microbulbifer aestuariivivens TaxID=1908308 RepID=A0ABP9WR01_9GAMM
MNKTLYVAALSAAIAPLAAQASEPLELLTVTASRTEIPKAQLGVSVSVLTAADIERLGYASMLDVIRTLPGVAVSNNGGPGKVSSVFLRGESQFRTLILLDGVNIADPANTQVAAQFQHLLASDIERVEVLRGPQGMMYGAGAGGVINIITRAANEPLELQASFEAGRYQTQRSNVRLAGKEERVNFSVDLTQLDSEGFNSRESDDSGERDGYRNDSASARLNFAASDALSLEAQWRYQDAETEFDNCFSGFEAVNDCLDLFTQKSARVAAQHRAGALEQEFAISRQEIKRDSLSEGASSFAVSGHIKEFNYLGHRDLAAGALSWGAELEQQAYRGSGNDIALDGVGVFGEWRGDVAGALFYTVGLRRDQLENDDHSSWRTSLAYPIALSGSGELKLRGSLGTGFRAPSPFEVAYNLGEMAAPVAPERSRGIEIGAEYQQSNDLRAELVLFRQRVTDAIVYDYSLGTSGWGAYGQDDGESESRGAELALAGSVSEQLDWNFNGTWLDATDASGQQRLLVPQRVFNLGFAYQLAQGRLQLGGNWQRVEDRLSPPASWGGSNVELADYSKLDLNARYQWSDTVQLNLRGENVLNRDYREVAGYFTAGAAVYAGIELRL